MIALKLLAYVALCALSGWFYFLGGQGGVWWKNTRVRDLGCSALAMLALWILGLEHWTMILTFFALWGALATYNKWFGKLIFNRPHNDVFWEEWAITGLFYGLAFLPVAIAKGCVPQCLIYSLALAVATCLWSEAMTEVKSEAEGRGAFILMFLPILMT